MAQIHNLVPHGNLIAGQFGAGARVALVHMELLVAGRARNLSRLQVHHGVHATSVDIIYRAIAVAHADARIDHMRLSVLGAHRVHADGVHRTRINLGHGRVLHHHVLNQVGARAL